MIRRVNITGNAGAGKSSLAAELGRRLNFPVYGLDSIVWRPGWKRPPGHEYEQQLKELASRERWVIDGVSPLIREAADLVIFLDVPRRVCFFRCMKRNWRYLFSSRPGLPERCPELLIMPTLVKIIWAFPSLVKPKVLAEARHSDKYLHVTNRQQLDNIYAEITS